MAKFTWEHVHLRSPDPEATAQWYHDKLGADVIRTKNADGSTRIDLNLSGQKVFIAMADPANAATAESASANFFMFKSPIGAFGPDRVDRVQMHRFPEA